MQAAKKRIVRDSLLSTFSRCGKTGVRPRVARARAIQLDRQGVLNSARAVSELERHAVPDRGTRDLLEFAAERFNLWARACARILRVARTTADLESTHAITVHHVSEALLFRQLDGGGAGCVRDHKPKAPPI